MLRVSATTNDPGSALARRSFLQVGALGIGGLTLPALTKLQAEPAVRSKSAGKSVILFWLSGGPGHMETWDPKPDAPAEYRGPFGAIDTNRARRAVRRADAGAGPDRWTSWRSCGPSTTARATTPRATTGCSPALKARPSTPPTTSVQRRPALGSAVARAARRQSAGHAALCRRAAPARRHRQPLPLRGVSRRRLQPVRRQLRSRTSRTSPSATCRWAAT